MKGLILGAVEVGMMGYTQVHVYLLQNSSLGTVDLILLEFDIVDTDK